MLTVGTGSSFSTAFYPHRLSVYGETKIAARLSAKPRPDVVGKVVGKSQRLDWLARANYACRV